MKNVLEGEEIIVGGFQKDKAIVGKEEVGDLRTRGPKVRPCIRSLVCISWRREERPLTQKRKRNADKGTPCRRPRG